MQKKFHYTYITTNLINKKQYVGDHSTNNINDNYLGSGNIFTKAIKKYGKENFERKILEQFNTKEEAFNAQEKYIQKHHTLIPNGYNISPKGGHNVKGCISESTKEKISVANKGRITWMKDKKHSKYSKELNRQKHINIKLSKETKNKISYSLKDRVFTEEHKINLSKASKGKILSEDTKNKLSIIRKGKPPANKGIKMTEEQKQKMKDAWKKRKERGWKSSRIGKTLSQETKKKISEKLKIYNDTK